MAGSDCFNKKNDNRVVNHDPRRPESVLVIVYTDDEKILLLKRNKPFEFWQSVTGSLEADETPEDGARRELVEETGLVDEGDLIDTGRHQIFTIDPRWRDRFADGVTENKEYEWHFCLNSSLDIEIDAAEHSDWRWVCIDQAIDKVWSWTNKTALEKLRTELRSRSKPV